METLKITQVMAHQEGIQNDQIIFSSTGTICSTNRDDATRKINEIKLKVKPNANNCQCSKNSNHNIMMKLSNIIM